jgi:hypothetical protein
MRLLIVACLSMAVFWAGASPTSAGDTDCRLIETDNGYECDRSNPGSPGGSGSDSECVWLPYLPSLPQADYHPEFYDDPAFTGTYDGSSLPLKRTWPDGTVEHAYTQACPNAGVRVIWVDSGVTPRELAERAFARVELDPPVVTMSPAPEVGGVVNLGMWLAIEPQPNLSDFEREGAVWIELIGEYQGMEWDFGTEDEDTVECGGFGVEYEEGSDDPGEGPCGYTYEFDEQGDEPYTVSVTTNWSFRFVSDTESGPLGDLSATTTFDYQVYEIQTVGTSRD